VDSRTAHLPFLSPSSRYHIQIEDERSLSEMTTPTNPNVFFGSWAARKQQLAAPSNCTWPEATHSPLDLAVLTVDNEALFLMNLRHNRRHLCRGVSFLALNRRELRPRDSSSSSSSDSEQVPARTKFVVCG
jgi:hypothetical protein